MLVSIGHIERYGAGLFEAEVGSGELTYIRAGDIRRELEHCAIDQQPWIVQAAGIITLCADFAARAHEFAEQPPYSSRGSRYVYIEAGAAAQNVALQAAAEQLGCVLVAGFQDEATAKVLKLEPPYRPVLHLCLGVASFT
jgi:nitroreductase